MKIFTRRDFLQVLAAAAAGFVVSRKTLSLPLIDQTRGFEFLVVGDSLVWGQGLVEKEKFYSLVADWLRSVAVGTPLEVNLKVKAHSGSTLKFHSDEAEKYRKAGRDESYPYKSEINVGFPSIWKQIEAAADEYRIAGKNGADLVMISGGITDITTPRVFNPKGNDDELRTDIKRYCGDDMYDVLELAINKNPNAKLAVIGYFPAISSYSTTGKILNAWLETQSFPRPFKIFINNPLLRPLYFKKLKRRAIVRSRIWLEESDRQLKGAVERINAKYGAGRAVFVGTPLTDENAAEAPKTLLFRMGKGGIVKDQMAAERIKDCRETLPALKRETGIDYPVRLCEVASIGHPDPAGSRAYAEAIKRALAPLFR